jgi:hypothetical protein
LPPERLQCSGGALTALTCTPALPVARPQIGSAILCLLLLIIQFCAMIW